LLAPEHQSQPRQLHRLRQRQRLILQSAITAYRTGHEAAINTFKSAVATAKATKEAAVKAATTPEAKAAAKTAFQSALATAKATRDAAIAALGTKPVRPAQPAK
jgi:hypothetical protein